MSESKFLTYGDYIYLCSIGEQHKTYMSARSILEEEVYFVQCPFERQNSVTYENQTEMVFAIYPKLNYQAYKNFTKLKPNDDSFKVELIKKRLIAEQKQNAALVEKMSSVPVTFGSEVQLFHVASKSFVRATREKNTTATDQQLYNIKLSRKGGSGFYFKITPYYSFKKEGEKLTLADKFYLENIKLKASIVYKNVPIIEPPVTFNPDGGAGGNNTPLSVALKSSNSAKIVSNQKYPPVMEFSLAFNKYQSGLRQQDSDSPFTVNLIKNRPSQNITTKQIMYGDYVRLKFMLSNKKTGYFYSDPTIVGNTPYVFCRSVGTNISDEKESFQSIFQIVPFDEDDYGTPVKFVDQIVSIRLRHFLTGQYLEIGLPGANCSLSEKIDDYLMRNKPQTDYFSLISNPNPGDVRGGQSISKANISKPPLEHSRSTKRMLNELKHPRMLMAKQIFKQNSIRDLNKSGGMSKQATVLNLDGANKDKDSQNILGEKDKVKSDNIDKDGENDKTVLTNGPDDDMTIFTQYLRQTSVILQNASQDQEAMLTTSSVFTVKTQKEIRDEIIFPMLKVNVNRTDEQGCRKEVKVMDDNFGREESTRRKFHERFHSSNPLLEKEEYEVMVENESDQYYFFSPVSNEDISELISVQSRIYPLIQLYERTNIYPEAQQHMKYKMIGGSEEKTRLRTDDEKNRDPFSSERQQALEILKKLTLWLRYEEDEDLTTGKMSTRKKQKLIREIGLIDLVIDILGKYFNKKHMKSTFTYISDFRILVQSMVGFLGAVIKKNQINNLYVFQWDELLLSMALSNDIASDLGLDKLVSQIFSETIIGVGEVKKNISKDLEFENYDLKALNIAIALYRYNPKRIIEDRNNIISKLIKDTNNREKIFRKFKREDEYDTREEKADSDNIIVILKKGVLKIDNTLEYREKKQFDFVIGIINLTTEICKIKPQVVAEYLSDYFSMTLCTDIFQNKKWNYNFRSSFLDLFTQMYFINRTMELPDLEFPINTKFLTGVKMDEQTSKFFERRKEESRRYFETLRFDLKDFVRDFLDDPHKWGDDEHRYVRSVFELIYKMCKKGLYPRDKIKGLKFLIYNYLKVGLAAIHEDIIPEHNVLMQKNEAGDDKKQGQLKDSDQNNSTKEEEKKEAIEHTEKEGAAEEHMQDEVEKESYWKKTESTEMISWMQEILNILIFIEYYELDYKLKDFFDDDKTNKFFNEKLVSLHKPDKDLNVDYISKIKKDKENYVLKYLNDNFVLQNYKHTLLLIELLLINNLSLTCNIVHLLYLNFSGQKRFLVGLNQTEVVTKRNVNLYNNYVKIYDAFRVLKIKIESLHEVGREEQNSKKEFFEEIDLHMDELLEDLYPLLDDDDIEKFQREDPTNENQIYDKHRFDTVKGKDKQSLLKNLQMFEISLTLFYTLVESKKVEYLSKFIYFYLFYCFKNQENQEVMSTHPEFLKKLFEIEVEDLQPLLLRLISEIFKNNYSLLVKLPQKEPNIMKLLTEKFFNVLKTKPRLRELKEKKMIFLISCLRIFPTFFQIRTNFLTQNQIAFAKEFQQKASEDDLGNILHTELYFNLSRFLTNDNFKSHIEDDDPYTVNVPIEVSFSIYFLMTFAVMVAGPNSSNSQACASNKYYLSIPEIQELLELSTDTKGADWINLKLALLTYFNHVYVRNRKLEANEVSDLYNIMRNLMFDELNAYNRFVRNRHLYSRDPKQKFAYELPSNYKIETEFTFCNLIDDLYHQYIIYGALDSYRFYAERMKQDIMEKDHQLLDDYVSSQLPEIREYWNNQQQYKRQQKGLDGMINSLPEPSDPDLDADNDLFLPQKDERMKIQQLKREINKLTSELKKREDLEKIALYRIKANTKAESKSLKELIMVDSSVIEYEHNQELEILVKFLLELKLENGAKFQIIIKSFMNVLASEDPQPEIKQSTLKILRKLSNFKDDEKIYESILVDFVNLDFIHFFLTVIVDSKTEDDRLEFILGMIDFLDDASAKIQTEFHQALVDDEDNVFLDTIQKFITTSFESFRENEKNYNEQSKDIQQNARVVVYKKMYYVVFALELLRFSCENHFEDMQNYLREQVQHGVVNKRSINFIHLIADIFNRYVKSMNERNAILGIKILDTLIELLQGPCQENQLSLCSTKILENLEDLHVEIKDTRAVKDRAIWTEMNAKVITLMQAILEGSSNPYIIDQVASHINVSFLMDRMEEVYRKFYKLSKKKKKDVNKKESEENKLSNFMNLNVLESNLNLEETEESKEDKDFEIFVQEGIALAIILKFLADEEGTGIDEKRKQYKQKLSPEKLALWSKAERFYNRSIGQIEIVNRKGDLQRIYFPIEKETKYLSNVSKDNFLDDVPRETANEKLFGLIRQEQLFTDEMEHFASLRNKGLRFSLTYFSLIRNVNLVFAFVTNGYLLFNNDVTNPQIDGDNAPEKQGDKVIRALGIVHIVLSGIVLLFWIVFKAPLDLKAAGRKLTSNVIEHNQQQGEMTGYQAIKRKLNYYYSRLYYMLFNTYMLYFIGSLIFAILGTFYSKVFLSLLLLDLIDRSVILNNVVKSITQNYKQLLMTAVLGLLLIYIYAVIGFFVIVPQMRLADSDDEENGYKDVCESIFECFLTILNGGLRAGGGIGEILYQPNQGEEGYEKRYFFDLLFFLMIIIILLNIIFGIIIDTFAELRDEKGIKDYDNNNRCYICNIDRTSFEKEGKSFVKHTRKEHFIWYYLYYIVYLKAKHRFEYNGTESYIQEKLSNDDLSWFPILRAKSLSQTLKKDDTEEIADIVDEKLATFEKKMLTALQTAQQPPAKQ